MYISKTSSANPHIARFSVSHMEDFFASDKYALVFVVEWLETISGVHLVVSILMCFFGELNLHVPCSYPLLNIK